MNAHIESIDIHKLGIRVNYTDGTWAVVDPSSAVEILWGVLKPLLHSRGEAERDGERWLFLMLHWNSMYKGKPLHRYMDEESLRLGGIEACLDKAMAAAHASRLLQPERATSPQEGT